MRWGVAVLLLLGAALAGCGGSDGPDRMTPADAVGYVEYKSALRHVDCEDLPGGREREFRCTGTTEDDRVRLDLAIAEGGDAITASACKVIVRSGKDPCERFPVAPRG